jgi:hypothetical protein
MKRSPPLYSGVRLCLRELEYLSLIETLCLDAEVDEEAMAVAESNLLTGLL